MVLEWKYLQFKAGNVMVFKAKKIEKVFHFDRFLRVSHNRCFFQQDMGWVLKYWFPNIDKINGLIFQMRIKIFKYIS